MINRPTKIELEKFIGKNVEVTIFDGDVYKGILISNEEKNNKSSMWFSNKGFYHCDGSKYHFRSSHVIKVREVS